MTFKTLTFTLTACLAFGAFGTSAAFAQVDVKDAWARATVSGQKSTGAFMKLTAKNGSKLVQISSPVAGVTEVHEMKMEGDVMKMRALPVLDLPAGQTVELKPGGYHVMLMDLKGPLAKDSVVELNLTFKDAKGVESRQNIKVPVAVAPSVPAKPMDHAHHHGNMKH